MPDKLRYRPAPVFTRDELLAELESSEPARVADAIMSAVTYEDDWKWVQDKCLELLASEHVQVRWAAATGLGDLAFLSQPIEHRRVLDALYSAALDPSIADPAQFSIDLVKARFPLD